MESKEVHVEYCPTEHMVADILTKPIVGDRFYRLRSQLLNLDA
jgi:hypothetical protein